MPTNRNIWMYLSLVRMVRLMMVIINAGYYASTALGWHVFAILTILVVVLFSSGCTAKLVGTPNMGGTQGITAPGASKAYNRPYKVKGRWYYPMASAKGYVESGIASWYGWESGNQTATGEFFDPRKLTAAHRTLPLPTKVHVTNLENHRSVVVVVNDRGPFIDDRLIDLSAGAAQKIGMRRQGIARVRVVVIDSEVAAR